MSQAQPKIRAFYESKGLPFQLHLDLLYACDLDCHHCYLEDKKRKQVSTERIKEILDEAAALGSLALLMSGGEIFLRKDLLEIVEHARKRHFHVRLKTHGGHVTQAAAERLAELGVTEVDISIYALDDEVHDAFTKQTGSLRNTLRGIQFLVDAGIRVETKCSVTTFNLAHYRDLYEHFRERGIHCSFTARIRGTNSVNTNTYPLGIAFEEKVQLEMYKMDKTGGPRNKGVAPRPNETVFCSAGRGLIYIAPDLKVYPCVAYPEEWGDLNHQTLRDIWKNSPLAPAVRKATRADLKICETCAARMHCSYCPGAAFIENGGDALTPPDVVCNASFSALEAEERYLEGQRARAHEPAERPKKKANFQIAVNLPTGGGSCGTC